MNSSLTQILGRMTAVVLLAALPLAAGAQKVEDRLTRIERLLDSGVLTDMLNQQEQLRTTLQELQGEVELLRRDLDEIKQRQHDNYLDTDRRLRQLEAAASAPARTEPATPTPEADDAAAAAQPPGSELDDYRAALAQLKAGRYAQAATAFETFLQRHPQGQFTANALYWLGESYYVVRQFDQAMPHFQRVLKEHSDSSKAVDALLKVGFIHHELGDLAQARQVLERVRSEYPQSAVAALAEQRLRDIGSR